MKAQRAFTLVELLLVLGLLAILAVIVIAQVSNTSDDAAESALATDLQTVRIRISLYRAEHQGKYPGQRPDGSVDGVDFVQDLTGKTNANGEAAPNGPCGPYLQGFPRNPFLNYNRTVKVGDGSDMGGTQGWYFNSTNGRFSPNDGAHQNM